MSEKSGNSKPLFSRYKLPACHLSMFEVVCSFCDLNYFQIANLRLPWQCCAGHTQMTWNLVRTMPFLLTWWRLQTGSSFSCSENGQTLCLFWHHILKGYLCVIIALDVYLILNVGRCEKGVMSSVNVRNCIRFYQTAEELNATTLMNYCGEIIASHWVSSFSVCSWTTRHLELVCVSMHKRERAPAERVT